MHSLLEAYLEQVAAHLSVLPVKRRNEELREMRQHLLNAVTVNRELGQSEEEAAQNAMTQFGTSEDLGENLMWAWRREEKLNKCDFGGAVICALILPYASLHILPLLQSYLLSSPSRGYLQMPFSIWVWIEWTIWLTPLFLLIGGVSGFLFPKRAAAGVAMGLISYHLCFLASELTSDIRWAKVYHQSSAIGLHQTIMNVGMDIIGTIISAGAAWAGSRVRLLRSKRVRLLRS